MGLVEDTRQQRGKHQLKSDYFESIGERVVRCALPVGDYQRPARVAVDTKKDIVELAMNLKKEHQRFKRECETARDIGTQLVILVENEDGVKCLDDLDSWIEPFESYSKRNKSGKAVRYTGHSIAKACQSMHDAFGVMFGFCAPGEAGKRVIEILDMFG